MADIFHSFPINASAEKVFEGISTSKGLDNWWTKSSEGKAKLDSVYTLYFGSQYNWKAVITKCKKNKEFELQMTDAYPEWLRTKIGFFLKEKNNITQVEFYHSGWPENSENYRVSNYCWAMYLRILKRYIEYGEQVPYEKRLSV